jgi:hypothetical protein
VSARGKEGDVRGWQGHSKDGGAECENGGKEDGGHAPEGNARGIGGGDVAGSRRTLRARIKRGEGVMRWPAQTDRGATGGDGRAWVVDNEQLALS